VEQTSSSDINQLLDQVHRLEGESAEGHWNRSFIFVWQVDGSKLAAGFDNGTVVVWNEDGSKSFKVKHQSGGINCIRWNPVEEKSHLFVTGSDDQVNPVDDSVKTSDKRALSADRGPSFGTRTNSQRSKDSIFIQI
jgi:WD domain, G-beta repeat